MRVIHLQLSDITQELVDRCNKTSVRYTRTELWTLASLRRQFNQHLVYHDKGSFLFLAYDDQDAVILVVFPDIIQGNPNSYGIDIAHKWYFYDADLLEYCPLVKGVRNLRDNNHVKVSYPVYDFEPHRHYDLRSLSKSVSGNFNSHLFGDKSTQVNVDTYQLNQHNLRETGLAYTKLITILKMYGTEKWYRFGKQGGDLDTNKDMFDILWHIDNLMQLSDTYVTIISDKNDVPLGFISYYRRGSAGYTHEIICSTDPQYKKYSLVPVLHLHAISELWALGCSHVNLGYNFDDSGDYKSFLKTLRYNHFKVNQTLSDDFENVKTLLLNLGEENVQPTN